MLDHISRRDKGLLYQSTKEVFEEQKIARKLTYQINTMDTSDFAGIAKLVKKLIPDSEGLFINPPFHCDYGTHISVGKNCFFNYNCTFLDVVKISIGDYCFLAPNVSIYTAGHPIHPQIRNTGYEYGIPVKIGNSVWIGGNTVICPGVTIGNNVVIGAGSVVTKDIPDWSVAAGNPCKVIRKITDEDKKYYFKNLPIDADSLNDMIEHNYSYTLEFE